MQISLENLTTPADLLAKIQRASGYKLTREDILEQKVSFVYGSIDSEKNALTQEQVRDLIMSHEGESKRGS